MITKKLIKITSLGCLLVMLLAANSTATAQSKKDIKRAKDLSDQGDKLFKQKSYKEAADVYERRALFKRRY